MPKPKPDINSLVFGAEFTDHMLSVEWTTDSGWGEPKIMPYQNLTLAPSCSVFHYALEVSEDYTRKRDCILTINILIVESLQGGSSIFQEGMTGTLGVQNQWGMLPKCCNMRIGTELNWKIISLETLARPQSRNFNEVAVQRVCLKFYNFCQSFLLRPKRGG